MDYWYGGMNWNLQPNWKCEVCDTYVGLTWGLVHGECRCNNCHAPYTMRDGETVLLTPKSELKPEYLQAAKYYYPKHNEPIDTWSDYIWNKALENKNA